MKLDQIGDKLQFSASDLFDGMSADELAELAQTLGCQRQVLDAVADQIIQGSTENGCWGDIAPIRDKILGELDQIAQARVDELTRTIEWHKQPKWLTARSIPGLECDAVSVYAWSGSTWGTVNGNVPRGWDWTDRNGQIGHCNSEQEARHRVESAFRNG